MCGIAGFVGHPFAPEEAAARLRAMCDAIAHRGPDSDGFHVEEGVALGMRRLSIIDVAGGRQPIRNEDDSVTVVFNGEIYNHRALRHELEATGHRFRTHSDTEVLVHLYEEHGPDMAVRLHGMFAFAIWDARTRTLMLARDRTGMKPLSYRDSPDGLSFCSELRSLWALDDSRLRVSPGAVTQYLAFGYVPEPASIFEGVRKLPPGHLLLWQQDRAVQVRRYWLPPRVRSGTVDEDALVETLRDKLDAAVASHLESEVPLGAFLSGGLDSSTVVSLMSRHAAGRVKTFSIGFAEEDFNEADDARAVAAELGTEHTELVVDPDVEAIFTAIAEMFDEPFADSSAIPSFLVARLARESVTVALSGDGGDELFGGYTRYPEALARSGSPAGAFGRAASALGLTLPHLVPGRNRLIDLGRTRLGRYAATVAHPVRLDEGGVAREDVPGGLDFVAERLQDRLGPEPGDDFAATLMRLDLETYLPGDILTKVDRTSMAVSLEARVPLLDCDLVDFALQLPGELRVTATETKRLFRRAIRGIVPDAVLRRPKRGFAIPLGRWFRGPLRHRVEALKAATPELQPFVDAAAVKRLVFEHLVGRRDHSAMLWRLMVLDCWLSSMRRGGLGTPPGLPEVAVARAGRHAGKKCGAQP